MSFPHPVTRAPDSRFDGLPSFGFAPHFVDDLPGFKGLRIHDLDEGPATMPGLAQIIRRCPPPPEIPQGGHLLPEWGEAIAHTALEAFGDV